MSIKINPKKILLGSFKFLFVLSFFNKAGMSNAKFGTEEQDSANKFKFFKSAIAHKNCGW